MDIQAEKLEILKMVLEVQNPKTLEAVKSILSNEKQSDYWESIPNGHKEEVELGMSEVQDGEVVEYERLMKKHRR